MCNVASDLDGRHSGLGTSLQQVANGVVDGVVDAAATGAVLELVDVEARAEIGARTRDHHRLHARVAMRALKALKQGAQHCAAGNAYTTKKAQVQVQVCVCVCVRERERERALICVHRRLSHSGDSNATFSILQAT